MTNRAFLHESEYRGADALAKIADVRITLCGAGAIGSLLADNLARQGFRNFKIVDCDRVDEHNVGTQLYDRADVGARKAELLRNRLFRACGAEAEVVTKRLDGSNARKFLKETDLVIDAFDNSGARQAVQDCCRKGKMDCLHVGLFEDYCEAIWDANYRVPGDVDGDVCEYPLARNLVSLAVTIASELVVRFVVEETQQDLSATLRDLAVRQLDPRLDQHPEQRDNRPGGTPD